MGSGENNPCRVFLSHTSEIRFFPRGRSYLEAVESAVSAAGHVIVDMREFAASDAAPAQVCQEKVRGCELYLGIFGTRYGSPVRDRPELSYTELEFETASDPAHPLERLVFLLDQQAENPGIPAKWLNDPIHGARQEAFLRKVKDAGLTLQTFRNPDELARLVERSLAEWQERVRARQAAFAQPRQAEAMGQQEQNGGARFAVGFSFAGEDRALVAPLAEELARRCGRERVLFDRFLEAELARLDLDVYLPRLYRDETELIVVLLSPDYPNKRWCGLEWRWIRQLIVGPAKERIMLLRVGDPGDLSELGILAGDGYLDVSARAATEISALILERMVLQGVRIPEAAAPVLTALAANPPRRKKSQDFPGEGLTALRIKLPLEEIREKYLEYIPSNAIDQAQEQVDSNRDLRQGMTPTAEILTHTFDEIETRARGTAVAGIPVNFYDLDAITQGLQRNDLIIVAGRPAMGKTSIMLNIAKNVAQLHNLPVAVFSLEMSKEQLTYRLLSM
ncbi:MAG: DnaB-like helicase C-terminal domain-containing protein, partial [Cyanobium sp. ELA712]